MSRVAVVGAGSIGGAVAALLHAAGHEVALCVRTPFDNLEVEGPEGTRQLALPVYGDPATLPAELSGCPWVLLATKCHQTASAVPWLAALAGPDTVVAVLQNGVEHVERVSPLAGPAQVLPVIVNLPASRRGPGRVSTRRRGRLRAPEGRAGEAFARLFEAAEADVATTPDFVTEAWRKLCLNASSGAVTCLTDQPLGVIRQPGVTEIARGLIRECVAVARAEGAQLSDEDGDAILRGLVEGPGDRVNSMLQDLRAGRALEWDARNAAVSRIGARHGIPTPLTKTIVALLAALDPGDPSRT